MILGIIIIMVIGLILFPVVLKRLITKIGMDEIDFSYVHPFRLSKIKMIKKLNLSYFKQLIIYINNFKITIRNKKIVFSIYKPQIILQIKQRNIEEINFLKPNQDPKIIHNLHQIIQQLLFSYFLYFNKSDHIPLQELPVSNFKKSIKGLLNFTLMLLTQCIFIEIIEFETEICDQLGTQCYSQQQILKRKCLSNFSILSKICIIQFTLNQENNINLKISNNELKVENCSDRYKQFYKEIIRIKEINLCIEMPFNFTLQQSLEKCIIRFGIKQIILNFIPINIDQIFQLISGINFYHQISFTYKIGINQQQNKIEQSNKNSKSYSQFHLNIDSILLNLEELYEKQFDTIQSREFLENITLLKITSKDLRINILSNSGPENLCVQVKEIKAQSLQTDFLFQLFKLQNFIFELEKCKQDPSKYLKKIRHDDVNVETSPQTISILAKIFKLILRTRRQHYELENYKNIFDYYIKKQTLLFENLNKYQKNYYMNDLKIEQKISVLDLFFDYQKINKQTRNKNQSQQKISDTVLYEVNQIVFHMKIRELSHKLIFSKISFKKIYEKQSVINLLEIKNFNMLLIQNDFNQFNLSSISLYIKQSQFLDECDIFINELNVNQNENTFIEYLVGFPFVKSLLQISSKESKIQQFKKNKQNFHIKLFRFNYLQIFVNIDDILFQTNQFEFQKRQINLNIKKSLICTKFTSNPTQPRFLFINPNSIKTELELFKVQSINIINRIEPNKITFLFIIKNPKIIIPKELIRIGNGLTTLYNTYMHLNLYIEAYIKNISDEVLKEIKFNLQKKIQFPDYLTFKIINLNFVVEDSQWNTFFLNYQRFGRQYFYDQTTYNQKEIMVELNRKKQNHGLMEFGIEDISLEIKPMDNLQDQGKVIEFMKSVEKNQIQNGIYNHMNVKMKINKIFVKFRDYPFKIIDIKSINTEIKLVDVLTKNQTLNYYYLEGKMNIGLIDLNVGLNLNSVLKQIVYRYNQIISGYDNPNFTIQQNLWINQITKWKNKKYERNLLLQQLQFVPYWQFIRKRCFFNIQIDKKNQTKINLLTNIYPYSKQAIQFTMGETYLLINKQKSVFNIKQLLLTKQIDRTQFTIMKLGNITYLVSFIFKPLLNIETKLIFNENDHHYVHVRKDILEYLVNLNQLRTDILLLYGFNLRKSKSKFGNLKGQSIQISLIKWFSYIQVAKLAFDNRLDQCKNTLSLWNIISAVNLTVSIKQFGIIFSFLDKEIASVYSNQSEPKQNKRSGFQILIGNSRLKLKLIPVMKSTNSEWIIKDGSGKILNIIGKYYYGRIVKLVDLQKKIQDQIIRQKQCQFIQEKKYINRLMKSRFQKFLQVQQEKQEQIEIISQKDIFFLSSNLIFIRNHIYQNKQGIRFIITNFLEYQSVKFIFSSQTKKIFLKLINIEYKKDIFVKQVHNEINLTELNNKFQKRDQQNLIMKNIIEQKLTLIQKFRTAVKLIIAKKREIKKFTIKKNLHLDFLFILKNPQFNLFYEQKNCQVIFTSIKNCFIEFKKQYLLYDTLQIDPKITTNIRFQSFQIWTSNKCNKVNWVNKKTILNNEIYQLLQSKSARFKIINFNLSSCDIDFNLSIEQLLNRQKTEQQIQQSKSLWGTQKRIKYMEIQFQSFTAEIDQIQKNILFNIIQFLILMSSSKSNFIRQTKIAQAKSKQIQIYGKNKLLQKLISKCSKNGIEFHHKLQNYIKLILNKSLIKLINKNGQQNCMMILKANQIFSEIRQFNGNYIEKYIQIRQIILENPKEQDQFKYILLMQKQDKNTILFNIQTYNQSVFEESIQWPYHKLISIIIQPIKFKFTDELYKDLYQYFFSNKIEVSTINNRYKPILQIEQYYNKIVIDPITVQIWYRSTNILKKMNGIELVLEKFVKGNKFSLKKQIFDNWIKFVLKQLTGQIFSVIGQKIFGNSKEDSSDDQQIIQNK